ncbi:MAG: DNA gyrase subunit A [Bacteroidaceae bacterium]|nr:DNA gyrase subunit A [Bacteroidaceae bacterium]
MTEDRIKQVYIESEMKKSYIDYSMSVIVARALPDVRDGFKPVHRRILFDMDELGITHDKPTRKSARVVGDVLGKYHPHGDSSVYGALVRLAQDWNMRYTLVEGQGNFGSMDGDSAAAMRYTEVRLSQLGEMMMQDIEKETVDMVANFDNTRKEPSVMPTRIPNFLVNGATGIAVGMATNVPTHNLGEVIDGCVAYIDNPEIDTDGLMQHIQAPDFPTGGYIMGLQGVKSAYETGRGRIIMRAKANIESGELHDKIVVTEIPYGVNKADLVKSIAELVNERKIEGISNVNDESDREGLRIVVDVKRDANAGVVLNKLYKLTTLQTSFSVNCIALVGPTGKQRPKLLTLKECIAEFVKHRHEVVLRRTAYELRKAQERAHILEGLIIASDNIDEVVRIIRASKTPESAVEGLMQRFSLDEIQAKAIVEMRLRQLTNLMQDKLHEEYDELQRKIAYYEQILSDDELCKKVIKDELIDVKEKYSDERRTEIVPAAGEWNPEDFYANDDVVITISHLGYIKRTPLADFRAQARGGVGSKGGSARDADFIEYIYPATMHNTMLFFTSKGRCYKLKVYELPEGNKASKGRAIQNMLNIEPGDSVNACLNVAQFDNQEYRESHNIVFCTKQGVIKKTLLDDYKNVRAKGIIAINLRDDDQVVSVCLTNGENEIIVANRAGRAIRFNENTVRTMGRGATGVKAMAIDQAEDEIVGMVCIEDPEKQTILVVSEQGFGKRSSVEDYRITNRGGKGVKTLNVTEKVGELVAIKCVTDEDDLMIINKSGITIRLKLSTVSVQGRVTQGVRLINLTKRNDVISNVCIVPTEEEEEVVEEGQEIVAPESEGNAIQADSTETTENSLPSEVVDNE